MAKRKKSIDKHSYPVSEIMCAAFVIFAGTFYLLTVPSYGYSGIAEWKYSVFLLSFIGLIVLMAEQKLIGGKTALDRHHFTGIFPQALLAYFLFTCVSGLASSYPGAFLGTGRHDGILTAGLYISATLLLAGCLNVKNWMLFVFGGAVTLFCALGIVQLTGANPFLLYPEGMNFYGAGTQYSGQYWSTTGNVNLCAALLSVSAGAFGAAAVRAGRPADWLCLIPLNLSVFSIIKLNSEAGMVALLGGFLLMLPFVVTSGKAVRNLFLTYGSVFLTLSASTAVTFFDGGVSFTPGKRTAALCAGAAVLLACGALLGKTPGPEKLRPSTLRVFWVCFDAVMIAAGLLTLYFYDGFGGGFLFQAHELLHGHWDDTFGSGRLFIWRQAWGLVRESPLLGGGPDSLGLRGLEEFSRYNEAENVMFTATIDVAHNEYLNILVNQGGLALAAYLTAIAASLVQWWRNPDDRTKAVAGAAALFYLLQAFFGISQYITAPYLWIALAILNKK